MTLSVEPLVLNLEYPNNGDYSQTWALTDKTTGDSLLDGSETLHLDIKETQDLDADVLLPLLLQPDITTTGFVMAGDVATSGKFQVTIRRSDAEPLVASGLKKVKLFFDFGVKYSDGFFIIYTTGTWTFDMGVTDVG